MNFSKIGKFAQLSGFFLNFFGFAAIFISPVIPLPRLVIDPPPDFATDITHNIADLARRCVRRMGAFF